MFDIDIINFYFIRYDNDGYQAAIALVDVVVFTNRQATGIRKIDYA